MFYEADIRAEVPQFNTLDLFAVPARKLRFQRSGRQGNADPHDVSPLRTQTASVNRSKHDPKTVFETI